MIRIRGPDQARRIDDPAIRRLVEQRFIDVCNGEPYDYDTHGEMIVVETGDTVDALEKQSGCSIVSNPFDDARYGEPDFAPVCEALEEHAGCYEMVFIFTDDGFGISFFIPKHPGIDAELLAMCAQFAGPMPDQAAL